MKIALLVLYNHRYDKNIPRIESIYAARFTNVFQLVPFYDGNKENVIAVYESSHHFQSYIAQAYQRLKEKGFTHYFVVADDMIINPAITENNLFEFTGISDDHCFIHNQRELHKKLDGYWYHLYNAYDYTIHQKGLEISNILPKEAEAKRILNQQGFKLKNLNTCLLIKLFFWFLTHKYIQILPKAFLAFFKSRKLKYPLIAGWSDILILPDNIMSLFCTYCGAFAASNLFVETAIPTALSLCTDKITTSKDLDLHSIHIIDKLPQQEQDLFYKKYEYNLNKLLSEYPQDHFFIHPIKLSKWK